MMSPRQELYDRFRDALPGIAAVKRKGRPNCGGTYFQRLWSFREPMDQIPKQAPFTAEYLNCERHNQLERIIQMHLSARTRGGGARRSGLQASLFDPVRDQTNAPYLKFPCLHQVSFVPCGDELVVTGYYGLQYLIKRAYGNYLGLCRLGRFMAQEMHLRLSRVTCIAGVGVLDYSKDALQQLRKDVVGFLPGERPGPRERSTNGI